MDETRPVYFDCAASAKPDEEIAKTALKISLEDYANPGSIHNFGTRCERLVDAARQNILDCLFKDKAKEFECIFDSGATEGNNIAVLGAAKANENYSKRIITTTAEHDSVSKVFDKLAQEGFEVIKIRVFLNGDIDWDAYKQALTQPVSLVSAIACSNQNGAILPVAKMAETLKQAQPRSVFHTDATQAITKVKMDWSAFDLITFSGHKIGGLRGTGALLKRKKTRLVAPEVGGGQEEGLRSGTLNSPGDVALALAVKKGYRTYSQRYKHAVELNKHLREGLKGWEEFAEILSPEDNCIPFVLTLGLNHHKASTMVQYLSTQGFYVSTTSACDSKLDEPNRILRAMGAETHEADNPIRLSFMGREDETIEDCDRFLEALKQGFINVRPQ